MLMQDIKPEDVEGAVAWAARKGSIHVDEVEALSLTMGSRVAELAPALAAAGVQVVRMSRTEKLKKATALAAARAKGSRA